MDFSFASVEEIIRDPDELEIFSSAKKVINAIYWLTSESGLYILSLYEKGTYLQKLAL